MLLVAYVISTDQHYSFCTALGVGRDRVLVGLEMSGLRVVARERVREIRRYRSPRLNYLLCWAFMGDFVLKNCRSRKVFVPPLPTFERALRLLVTLEEALNPETGT
jgi:hypothetical protein